jgi:DNA-binding response OmpR family regulator
MSGGRRVLVVEDEPSILLSLEFLLKTAGCEVLVARDGAEALRATAAARPDLIVLDIMLPLVDGFEVCRRIREDERLAGTRILMLTARGRREADRGMAAGADAYLAKPFATRELLQAVAALLGAPRAGQ